MNLLLTFYKIGSCSRWEIIFDWENYEYRSNSHVVNSINQKLWKYENGFRITFNLKFFSTIKPVHLYEALLMYDNSNVEILISYRYTGNIF